MISDNKRVVVAAVGLVVITAGLTSGMMMGRAESDRLFYACAFAQAGISLAAGWLAVFSGSRLVLAVLMGGAVLLRLWLVLQVPSLSGDVYRYIWDGRVENAGYNPYLHVPADPVLLGLRDPAQYGLIDKRDYAVTIYPPVAEALFALVTRLSPSVWAMKLAMVLLEGVAVWATLRLLMRLGHPSGWSVILLFHPAPLWEIAGNGHVDAAMMALLFGAFAWGSVAGRPALAALMLTLAALVKPTAALALPALWRPWQLFLPLAVLALAVCCYVPFLGAGSGILGFLPTYLHEQGLDTGQGVFWLALLHHLGLLPPWMTLVYGAGAAAALLGLALRTRWAGARDLKTMLGGTALLLVVSLLLLSPTLPWYFLVALPLTPLLGLWSPFALTTSGFLLYGFNADAPPFFDRWAVMMAVAIAAALVDARHLLPKKAIP
ncbi:glycosyltransferase 87 family protein [Lichenihabitans sp. PAMC28606]|uniref:glycosyltransferase 87 family protein n=1 Tax=Lichenihabitans sp. PAMC28606 TaxID=2880932 RepID=UPI001D0B060F|nr:glycosyltransferase 87 family protein [Lichenihabitans sp. PAMC28606]UDL93102.1 glycosyltransferase 87 family protein [Lichenihabitans sp. PAMC28606]